MIHILPSLNIVILVYGTFYEISYCKTQKVLK